MTKTAVKGAFLSLKIALEEKKFTRIILLGSASIIIWPFFAYYIFFILRNITIATISIPNYITGSGDNDPIPVFFIALLNALFDLAILVLGYAPIITYSLILLIMFVASLGLIRMRVASFKSSILMLLEQILLFGNFYFLLFLFCPPSWKVFGEFETLGIGLENWVASPGIYLLGWLHTMWLAVLGWVLNSHPKIEFTPILYVPMLIQFITYFILTTALSVHLAIWVKACIQKYEGKI